MKPSMVVGILLVVLGIAGFVVGGFSYTHEKKDVDLGSLQIQHKETRVFPISPWLSALVVIGGVAMVIVATKSK
ncbi:MAG TPA: DUF4383 domain-containing protein [Acidisarcina sp.]|nr:DUF4383 domain-containing protein [Acidisarcina sp.]